jgi:hypothetical protein
MAWHKVETQNLQYLRGHEGQTKLRASTYGNIKRAVAAARLLGQTNVKCGKILPSTYRGSARNRVQNYREAMATVQTFGKPSLFITFTANAKWKSCYDACLATQPACDVHSRDDLLARVFKLMMDELMCDLLDRHVLGRVDAYMYVIEFQQRGYPHAHMLLILAKKDRPVTGQDIDELVTAELPVDPVRDDFPSTSPGQRAFDLAMSETARLRAIVCETMVHRDCRRVTKRKNKCCDNAKGTCEEGYPKAFLSETQWSPQLMYPMYRRRKPSEGGMTVVRPTCRVPR